MSASEEVLASAAGAAFLPALAAKASCRCCFVSLTLAGGASAASGAALRGGCVWSVGQRRRGVAAESGSGGGRRSSRSGVGDDGTHNATGRAQRTRQYREAGAHYCGAAVSVARLCRADCAHVLEPTRAAHKEQPPNWSTNTLATAAYSNMRDMHAGPQAKLRPGWQRPRRRRWRDCYRDLVAL
jgi:hypothetical protein